MSQTHKTVLSIYKGNLKLPSSPVSFADRCSNRLSQFMTNEDKFVKKIKNAAENETLLDKFGAYLKTFQRDT